VGLTDEVERLTWPFDRVPAVRRRSVSRAAWLVALGLLAVIGFLGGPLRGDVAPLGIVSLQLAGSPEVATAILASWSAVPTARILWAHGLDFVFPVAYAIAIGLTATSLAQASRRAAPAGAIAAGSGLVAAVADQVENLAMLVTLTVGPSWGSVLPTLVGATVKFSALGLAFAALALAASAAARSRSHGRRSRA